jgi:putative ABC transport system permease protein
LRFVYVKNELFKRGRRSLFVVSGIALSIGVLVAINSLSSAFINAAQKPLRDLGSDVVVQKSGDTPEFFEGATLPCAQFIITSQEVDKLKACQ